MSVCRTQLLSCTRRAADPVARQQLLPRGPAAGYKSLAQAQNPHLASFGRSSQIAPRMKVVAIFLALAAAAQAASVAAPLDLIDNLQVWIIFNQLSFFFDHLLLK